MGCCQLLLDQVPCQFPDALLIVSLYELLALILVVGEHDALQECVREGQLAHFLLAVSTEILDEPVVRITLQLFLQAVGNRLAKTGLVLDAGLFAVDTVPEFGIVLSLDKA